MLGAANTLASAEATSSSEKRGHSRLHNGVFPNLSSLKESCTGEMMVGPRDRRPSAHVCCLSRVSSELLSTWGPVRCNLSKKERIRRDVEFW